MTDRPILFSGPMVRALLGDRKTQTRRVLKPLPRRTIFFDPQKAGLEQFRKPSYGPGDRLWVRETWAVGNIYDGVAPRDINPGGKPNWCGIRYAATDARIGIKDRSPIHMPRWASRLTLIVTDVRVQRLREISHHDVCCEGVDSTVEERVFAEVLGNCDDAVIERFSDLWDGLNAKRGFGWDANPWVVALTFSVEQRNIDQAA